MRVLIIFIAFCTSLHAYDQTINYSNGDSIGYFTINGRPWIDSNRTDVPERIRFRLSGNFGLTVTHAGIPSCLLSCTITHYIGVLLLNNNGMGGFKNSSDTIWSAASQFTDTLIRYDSLIDPPPCNTTNGRIQSYFGDGFIHSRNNNFACQTSRFAEQVGNRRIIYFKSNQNIFIKLQVYSFELDSIACSPVTPPWTCFIAKNVTFKFHITDDSLGRYIENPVNLRPANKLKKSNKARIFSWKWINKNILGRK